MIKLFVTDFDGVLTDGKRYLNQENIHSKFYNMKDGLAVKNISSKGIQTMILSGDDSNIVKLIGERLKFDYIITNCDDKLDFIKKFIINKKISFEEILYIGDDLNDYDLLKNVRYRYVPNDCNRELLLIDDIKILNSKGGEGCISEIYNLINSYKKKVCFIPSRYQSSRLPGKSLLKINDKTIINMVYDQVKKCKLIDNIIVLTDDNRIKNEVESFGGNVGMVTEECLNGTERIVKFIQKKYDICDLVINVQGDEPFINPEYIDKCIKNFIDKRYNIPDMKCSTLHYIFENEEDIFKRSNGKIILDGQNNIMYCSRNVIPGIKNKEYDNSKKYIGHIGVFVYEKNYLMNQYLDSNTKYQLTEDIEWLKIIEDGYKINSVLVENHEIGLDTEDDYKYLLGKYSIKVSLERFDDLKKYKNIHLGNSAVLIGSGPSLTLNKENFKIAKNNNFLFFGNNDTIFEKEMFELDYFLLSDWRIFKKISKEKFINASTLRKKFFVSINNKPLLDESELIKAKGESFCTHGNSILKNLQSSSIGTSSIFITIQLIAYMGIKNIYLAGCDCSGKNYYGPSSTNYGIMTNQWKNIKKYLSDYFPEINIYSFNPVGLKNIIKEDTNFLHKYQT